MKRYSTYAALYISRGLVFAATTMGPDQHQRLEVESDEERAQRIERLLAAQASGSTPKQAVRADGVPTFPGSNAQPPFRMEAPSALLARLEAFLPQIRKANDELDAASANIENGSDGQGRYIEMSLGLGVFEQRPSGPSRPSAEDDDGDAKNKDGVDGEGSGGSSSSSSASESLGSPRIPVLEDVELLALLVPDQGSRPSSPDARVRRAVPLISEEVIDK